MTMLIDPPDFVSLAPALIYECDDLARENYKALLQVAGWMWVTKRHKLPLKTTLGELAERWGIKVHAVRTRLQVLSDREYLDARFQDDGMILLQLGPRALHRTYNNTPGEPATHTPSESGHNNTPREVATKYTQGEPGDNTPREVATHTPGEPGDNTPSANCLHSAPGVECKQFALPINNSNVVVVDPILSSTENQQQQQLIIALVEAGVFPDVAPELAADPWVTPDRVERWRAALERNERIKSVGAVLTDNLRHHREPPGPKQDRRRYVDGQYADYIVH